ncbi:MAG: MoaD/ThiS family protein [Thermodesulfobacteriota bacterium]|nr:MoaD/ThiS family protein [Thermodesulfobacteriota bacterium]
MQITVSLHGVFRIDRFKIETLEFPDGITAQKVIDELQIPAKLLGTILINKTHAKSIDILHDGDTLMVLPLLEGG